MSKLVHIIDYKKLEETIQLGVLYNRNKLSQNYFKHLFRYNLTRNESCKLFNCLKELSLIIPFGKTSYYMWSKKVSRTSYFTEEILKELFDKYNIQSKLGSSKSGRKKGQKYEYKVSSKSDKELLEMIHKCEEELKIRSQIRDLSKEIKNLADRFCCSINDLPTSIKDFIKLNKKYLNETI